MATREVGIREWRCAIARTERARSDKTEPARINAAIQSTQVRLVDTDGTQAGVVTLIEAQARADAKGLDLVEVASNVSPPVCRIMDFHKYRYEQRKRQQESRRNATTTSMKEVKIRSRTDTHDVEFKMGHILRFLDKGHRVKISVFFKGREITRPEMGREMLDRMLEAISDNATPEGEPRMEGRHMSIVVVPKK
ncbi:MAG: translation initiation factor IF-3 [Deltaproteobacteria bacterium]